MSLWHQVPNNRSLVIWIWAAKQEPDRLILTLSMTSLAKSKNELIRKHYKLFTKFTNEISFFKLNEVWIKH